MAQTVRTIADSFIVAQEDAANADCIDKNIWVAPFACTLRAVSYSHATAGSDGGAVNVMPRKCTGTDVITSGTALITNNAGAGFNCKGTANTVQTGTLSGTAANLAFAAGDRLALDYAGTITSLAGAAFGFHFTKG